MVVCACWLHVWPLTSHIHIIVTSFEAARCVRIHHIHITSADTARRLCSVRALLALHRNNLVCFKVSIFSNRFLCDFIRVSFNSTSTICPRHGAEPFGRGARKTVGPRCREFHRFRSGAFHKFSLCVWLCACERNTRQTYTAWVAQHTQPASISSHLLYTPRTTTARGSHIYIAHCCVFRVCGKIAFGFFCRRIFLAQIVRQ